MLPNARHSKSNAHPPPVAGTERHVAKAASCTAGLIGSRALQCRTQELSAADCPPTPAILAPLGHVRASFRRNGRTHSRSDATARVSATELGMSRPSFHMVGDQVLNIQASHERDEP